MPLLRRFEQEALRLALAGFTAATPAAAAPGSSATPATGS